MRVEPTFESCSYYLSGAEDAECQVFYRLLSVDGTWRKAYKPYFDAEGKELRGSLVRLEAGREYDIFAVLGQDTLRTTFTTWSDEPVVGRRIKISRLKKEKDGSIVIKGLHGTSAAWIEVVGDKMVKAGKEGEAAILIDDCSYVIFNNLTVRGGRLHGIKTGKRAENIRFQNCDISHWGREAVSQDSIGWYLDSDGNTINNDAGLCIYKSHNIVLERSYIHDPNGRTNTWSGIVKTGPWTGREYVFTHPQGPNAVYVMQSRGGIVLRHNDLVGSQTHRYNDPVEAWQNKDVYGGFAFDADIYGNVMAFGQDDAIELDGGQCNVRVYDNRIEQTYCGISTAPNRRGPSYIFCNLLWNMTNSDGKTGNAIKNGGGKTYTQGMQYLFNNTIIHAGGGMAGVGYGKDDNRELFRATLRNNIILSLRSDKSSERKGLCINDVYCSSECDFDYDYLGNICNRSSYGNICAYEGAEPHAVYGRPAFTNQQQAVFTLEPRDKGIGKGEKLDGFSVSDTPSLGAFQVGQSSLTPARPVDWEADKYCVTLVTDEPQIVYVKIGALPCEEYSVCMAEDMKSWLDVKCDKKRLRAGDTLTITIRKKKSVDYWQNGMIFLRLKNGYSLPITINTPLEK